MNFIAIDPGNTTGWARFRETDFNSVHKHWTIDEFGRVDKDDVWEWIEDTGPDLYVVENYRIRPAAIQGNYSHQWSSGETLRIIGAIDSRARRIGSPVVLQEPAIKPVGYGLAGIKYKAGKKGTHEFDAIAHGVYYLVKTLKVNPKCLSLAKGNG